jgi:CO/xanthine dehydrogenase Mo-binding subunit
MKPALLSRRALLQRGGGLVVGLALARGLAGATPAPTIVRGAAAGPPDAKQVDSWLTIHADNTAMLYIGFAELGQGATTALLQVAAEELDLGMDQIHAAPLDTQISPNQGGTYSSAAVQRGRPQVAAAAAEARATLLALAAARLAVAPGALAVERGTVRVSAAPTRTVSYGELLGGRAFDIAVSGTAPLKPLDQYRLVGRPVARADLRARVDGSKRFLQQMTLPGMLHGRVVRPRGQGAYGRGARALEVDASSIAGIPGARLLRQSDFLGVVAPREWDAVRAASALRVRWDDARSLPDSDTLHDAMRADTADEKPVLVQGDVGAAFANAAQTASQRCLGPYQAHAPFAPNCALADIRADGGLVVCGSQDIYAARRGLSALLGLKPEQLRVQFAEGAGTYGHSSYDDVAQAAALLSRLAGAPVRVQFMRWDEQGWDTYGPAHLGEVRVAADAEGRLSAYEYHGWQHNWSLVETTTQATGLQAAQMWPFSAAQGVNALTCGGMYRIANRRLVNHWLDGLKYLKGAWLRSPLDLSLSFASEQAIDALAWQLERDPVQFRRDNIADERWRGVLDAVAAAADWTPRRAAAAQVADSSSGSSTGPWRRGRGVGLGTHLVSHGAAVAELSVNVDSGDVRIHHLYGALDAGAVVNPGIVEAQITGQLVQTASRLLKEEVQFDSVRVTSHDWASYPILRFAECPRVTPIVVQRLGERSTGAGEETMAAAAAAIGNAFFDATGRRMDRYPLTPPRVRLALQGL